jgi:hypothetical protein
MKRLVALSACALVLVACTTPTVYGPATTPTASGFTETRIQSDRFRVTFRGGSGAGMERVHDLALLHAADVTLREGYDWFRIADRYGEASRGSDSYIGVGGGSTSYGHSSAVGVGGGISFPIGGGPRVSETLEIVLGKGPPPAGGEAYDARQIRQSLGGPPR